MHLLLSDSSLKMLGIWLTTFGLGGLAILAVVRIIQYRRFWGK